jgi:hypothetical protein
MRIHEISPRVKVVATPGRLGLDADLELQVQAVWEAEAARRPTALFNGRIFSIEELAPAHIKGSFVEYRWLVAQRRRADLFERLRVRPLAVSGLIESPDGLIFGRRGPDLATATGEWELAPSGGLEPQSGLHCGTVNYMRQFYDELLEEVGIEKTHITDAMPFVVVEEPATHVFDLGIAARTDLRAAQIDEAFLRTRREYSEVKVVAGAETLHFVDEHSIDMVSISIALLRHRGFIDRG